MATLIQNHLMAGTDGEEHSRNVRVQAVGRELARYCLVVGWGGLAS
jgi:hypothetical protein